MSCFSGNAQGKVLGRQLMFCSSFKCVLFRLILPLSCLKVEIKMYMHFFATVGPLTKEYMYTFIASSRCITECYTQFIK